MFPALSRWTLAFLVASCCFVAPLTAQSDAVQSQAQDASPAQNASPAPTSQDAAPAPTTNPDQQLPTLTIRQTVRRVIVDVMVRDASGKPVHGLAASDFSITEDKEPQSVLSFDVYDFDKASIARSPNAAPLPPGVFDNVPKAPERGPLYVMLLDLVNTETTDQMTARQQVLKFIKSKPAGTRFAVWVTTDKLYLVQGFTEDKDVLYAALDPKHTKTHMPKVFFLARNFGYGDPYTAVDMLTHIGEYMDGFPGRKNLIWVAGTFPLAIGAQEGDPAYLTADLKAAMNALAQAQIAVFPVDATGVVPYPSGGMTGFGAVQPNMQVGNSSSLTASQAAQDTIASATGGQAFYSNNGLANILSTATEDGGNYYTLTYSPPSRMDDGKCHNIAVKIAAVKTDKEKYQLSYRRSYCRVPLVSTAAEENHGADGTATVAVPLQAGDVLQANIKPGAPMLHDLVLSAYIHTEGGVVMATPTQMLHLEEQSAFYRTHRRNRPLKPLPPVKIQTYSVDYHVLDPQFKLQASSGGKQPTLEFAVAAFDEDGKVLNGIVNDGVPEASSQPAENKAGLYRLHQSLIVPAGAKSVRVGVRDRLNDRMGTLEVPLPLTPEPMRRAAVSAH
jgi:VWFA-related protein